MRKQKGLSRNARRVDESNLEGLSASQGLRFFKHDKCFKKFGFVDYFWIDRFRIVENLSDARNLQEKKRSIFLVANVVLCCAQHAFCSVIDI